MMHTHTYSNDRQNGVTFNCDDAECPVNTYGQHKLYGATDVGEGRPRPASPLRFPVQKGGTIPWALAEVAYRVYSARYGTDQSLKRLAERGGFGVEEMDMFVPGWREKSLEIDSGLADLRDQLAARDEALRLADSALEMLAIGVANPQSAVPVKLTIVVREARKQIHALLAQYNGEGEA